MSGSESLARAEGGPHLEHPIPTGGVTALTPARIRYLNLLHSILHVHAPDALGAVLEWGTGHSTAYLLELAQARGAERLVTLDHHGAYQKRIVEALGKAPLLEAHAVSLVGARVAKGRDTSHNYATFPLSLNTKFGLIYIDGRRRNECMLVARELLAPSGVVICHDATRTRYELGFQLFELISAYERAGGFRVMTLREAPPPRYDGSAGRGRAR